MHGYGDVMDLCPECGAPLCIQWPGKRNRSADPTTLYRLYDVQDRLLYVGIAGNPGRRFEQHASDKPWWGDVERIGLSHFGTRVAAERAETLAINDENPRYNITRPAPKDHTADGWSYLMLALALGEWIQAGCDMSIPCDMDIWDAACMTKSEFRSEVIRLQGEAMEHVMHFPARWWDQAEGLHDRFENLANPPTLQLLS